MIGPTAGLLLPHMGSSRARRRAGYRAVYAVLVLLGMAALSGSAAAQAGRIAGQLFTAEHPDSLAVGAELTLIFRSADGAVQRIPATAGIQGEYEFSGLPTDPALQYVIRVRHFGRDFLGAPIHFEPGEADLIYNFLVSRDAAPLPTDGMEGHPPIGSGGAARQEPGVRQDPLAMSAIVLGILALFALPIAEAYRRDRALRALRAAPTADPEAEALVQDIARLDLRFARGELESGDYQAVRRSLLRRLHELTGVAGRSA